MLILRHTKSFRHSDLRKSQFKIFCPSVAVEVNTDSDP